MSEYTTSLRWWCTSINNNDTSLSIKDNITNALPTIFNFDFPIFNENYRETLEFKIIHHFYFREIGFETPALFRDFLYRRLNEIMPYYNQRYNSELLTYDPFETTKITTTGNNSGTNNQSTSSNGSSSSNGGNSSAYSDTPQNGLSGVEDLNYLTNYTKDSNNASGTSTSSGTSTGNATGQFTETKTGKDGTESFMSLLKQYRESFLNIDMEVIKDLEDLFMQIY